MGLHFRKMGVHFRNKDARRRWPCRSIPWLGFDVDTDLMRGEIADGKRGEGQDLRSRIMEQESDACLSSRLSASDSVFFELFLLDCAR